MDNAQEKLKLKNYQRPTKLDSPNGDQKILLHSCCAPCAGEVILALKAAGYEQTVFFYNPNIHPQEEYLIRKADNKKFCDKHNIPCIDGDYDRDQWFEQTQGMEWEPERGKRCSACFDMRFVETAKYASAKGWRLISSTLGISRWKDMDQINASGLKAAQLFPNIEYWTFNWRKQGGATRMIELSKQEQFYQQEYCGCVYSLRDTNRWRQKHDRPRIVRGVKFYGKGGFD